MSDFKEEFLEESIHEEENYEPGLIKIHTQKYLIDQKEFDLTIFLRPDPVDEEEIEGVDIILI